MDLHARLSGLSVDELHQVQAAILVEIQHRKELVTMQTATAQRPASGGPLSGKIKYSGLVSIPVTAPTRPAGPRRAA